MAYKISNEVKVGIVVVLSLALLVWGFQFLKGKNIFENRSSYYALYNQVNGMSESSPVFINGLKVGLVTEIYFLPNDSLHRIVIKFMIDKNYRIPDSTVAEIYGAGIMESKAVRLNLSKIKDKFYQPGDTLISKIEGDLKSQVSAQMLPLKAKAEELMLSIDSVMSVVKNIFDENTRNNLSKTFESIKTTILNLEHTSIALDTLMQNEKWVLARVFANLESITNNLKNNNEQITKIMSNLASVSDSLQQSNIKSTILTANMVLSQANTIIGKINRGEGTLGMLINNDTLYRNIESASHNLDKLVIDLRENPKRYVRFSVFDFGKTTIVDEDGNKVKPKNVKPDTLSTSDNTIIYKIQIRSAKKQIPLHSKEFKGMENVKENLVDGWYKYTLGTFNSMNDAALYHEDLLIQFPDAFIVAYQGARQVPVKQEKEE
jgi:phospholipid/cholesterol/gamma-HCH transport system substrate-binding protein